MKRLIFLIIFTLICACGLAADKTQYEQSDGVIITSDSRKFNPLSGLYDLKGHVFVQFPIHGEAIRIKADAAQVQLYKQEVHGKGHISLQFGSMLFRCNETYVPIKERQANVKGNIFFQHEKVKIKADSASYNWKTKLATFQNASYNGGRRQPTLTYNVKEKRLL